MIWIVAAMAIGIVLGNTVAGVGPALQRGEFVGVSVPIGMYIFSWFCCCFLSCGIFHRKKGLAPVKLLSSDTERLREAVASRKGPVPYFGCKVYCSTLLPATSHYCGPLERRHHAPDDASGKNKKGHAKSPTTV